MQTQHPKSELTLLRVAFTKLVSQNKIDSTKHKIKYVQVNKITCVHWFNRDFFCSFIQASSFIFYGNLVYFCADMK